MHHTVSLISSILLIAGRWSAVDTVASHDLEKLSVVVEVDGNRTLAERILSRHGLAIEKEVFPGLGYYVLKAGSDRRRHDGGYATSFEMDVIERLRRENAIKWLEPQIPLVRKKRRIELSDPMWSQMWYMNNEYETGRHMNIEGAWYAGYTGKDVVVTILDDGIEVSHPDLQANYESLASVDLNDRDSNPNARVNGPVDNKHGTRCAGEVAAVAGNRICSVGVAFGCRIGAIRMLDGEVTDLIEAEALSFRPNIVDIYSASWGPDDNGRTLDGPGELASVALELGIKKGRFSKGNIFIWASGNGGRDDDNCNCDGYASSIYTITVSGVTEEGDVPWYAETCAATLVSAYSSGGVSDRKIVTTDINHQCTATHSGTSASAPLIAGIVALMLEANEDLSWRDVQYILVLSAKTRWLKGTGWTRNGAGFHVSPYFGFGIVDARMATMISRRWITLPRQNRCIYKIIPRNINSRFIGGQEKSIINFYTTGCQSRKNEVNYIEHVQAVMTLSAPMRGEISLSLSSPMKTNATLLHYRRKDNSDMPFKNWPFMTTNFWGESPRGKWSLEVGNKNKDTWARPALLSNFTIVIYGTSALPIPLRKMSRNRRFRRGHRPWSTVRKSIAHGKNNTKQVRRKGQHKL